MTFFDNPVITKNFRKVTLAMIKGQFNKVFVLSELPYELTGDEDEVAEYLENNTVKHSFEVTLSKKSKVQVRPLKGIKIDSNVTAQKSAIEAWINKVQVAKLQGFLSDDLIHNFVHKLGAPVQNVLGADALVSTEKVLNNFEQYNQADFIKGQLRMDMLELKKIMTEENYLPTSVELADRVNRYKTAIAAQDAANQVLRDREANYLPTAKSTDVTGNLANQVPEKQLINLDMTVNHNRVLLIEASKKSDKDKQKYYATKSISTDQVSSLINELKVAQLIGKDGQVTKQAQNLIEVNGMSLQNAASKKVTHTYYPVSQ